MSEHRWWKRYRAGRKWGNQYGHGRTAIPDGTACACGKALTEAQSAEWLAGVRAGSIRSHFSVWAEERAA